MSQLSAAICAVCDVFAGLAIGALILIGIAAVI